MRKLCISTFNKALILLVAASAVALTAMVGCAHPPNIKWAVAPSYSYSTKNGSTVGVTVTISGGASAQLVGATPTDLLEATPTEANVVLQVPQGVGFSNLFPPTATFTATTDTGYSSSIVVAMQQCTTCSVGTIPFGEVPVALEIAPASYTAWEAWMAQVAGNTSASANIAADVSFAFTGRSVNTGTYPVTANLDDSIGDVEASTTSSLYVPPPPPSGGCTPSPGVKCTQP